MKKNILAPLLLISIFAFSQNIRISNAIANKSTISLKGTISDAKTGEHIPFANIVIEQNGEMVFGVPSDFDGFYYFKGLEPGIYSLRISFMGYKAKKIEGIEISAGKTNNLDIKLTNGDLLNFCCVIYCYGPIKSVDPIIDLIAEQDSINKAEDKLLPSTGFSSNATSEDFMAYPVPSQGIVTLANLPKTNKMLLIDINGKILETIYVHDDSKMTLDLTRFQRGIYFLKYTEYGQQKTKRLMRQ